MTSNKNAYEDIIQTLGFEAVKRLFEEFDGGNPRRLAVKYGVSEMIVYRITKTIMRRKNKNELY